MMHCARLEHHIKEDELLHTQGVAALDAQLLEHLFAAAAAHVITLHEAARRALAAH